MVKRHRRSRAESSEYWRQQIADWKLSGQKIRAFCSQRNLTESQFHLWKRKLGIKPTRTPAGSVIDPKPTFVPVSVAGLRGSPITLEIHGAMLRIEPGVDVELLRAVLYSLKAS
jgi:hypothetical protein